ncbi:MAG: hypothetical protein KF830_08535 [Planctomycetes bacterium]|nr:hypothetical protein [Planctomycetota bacterium]
MRIPASPGSDLRRGAIEVAVALAFGALAYALSCVLVWPDPVNKGFGEQFEGMSRQPLALWGQFPHRILAPLLGWLCGMGGDRYLLFVRGLHVVMLACVVLYARRLGSRRGDDLLIAIAVAVTAPVQMYKQHWVGYCDPLAYTLSLLAPIAVRRRAVFWLLFLANLLTHELAVFLLPWLWFLRRQVEPAWRRDVPWVAGALASYAAFYLTVRAVRQPTYAADFFLDNPLLPWGALACWMMALTHWLLAYGPVLAVLAWHQHTRSHGRERRQLWLVLAGVLMILSIAFDWMRHANLIVLPFVLASARFLAAGHRRVYAGLVAGSVGLLLWVPPWSGHAPPTSDLWGPMFELVLVPKDFVRVVTHWIPAVWPILAVIYALLAAVWLLGWAMARRGNRAAAAA